VSEFFCVENFLSPPARTPFGVAGDILVVVVFSRASKGPDNPSGTSSGTTAPTSIGSTFAHFFFINSPTAAS